MEKIIEERRKEIERLAKIAYGTAFFNGEGFVRGYHEVDSPVYSPDYVNDIRYEYEIVTRNKAGHRICEREITIYMDGRHDFVNLKVEYEKKVRGKKYYDTIEEKNYGIDDILNNEELYNEVLKLLEVPFNRYYFKADDIISGKAYSLRPENSNVSEYIEEFLIKFAYGLNMGIPVNAWEVSPSYGPFRAVKPVRFYYSGSGKFKKSFENHLFAGHTETCDSYLGEVLEAIDFKSIFDYPWNGTVNVSEVKGNGLLLYFIQILFPNMLANWTKCLGPDATKDDFCKVLKIMNTLVSKYGSTLRRDDFVYEPEKSFTPELRAEIEKINEELDGRGRLFEDWISTRGIKRS